uniref:Putative flare n=1 Tax=Ixodes ricinus TaxID=34613 RepID=A0A0K8R9F3_IXORI
MGTDILDTASELPLAKAATCCTVSLSGFINYLDVNNPEKPLRVLKGHHKSITALAVSPNRETVYTGSHDGYISFWDAASGDQDRVAGVTHTNQVQDMCTGTDSVYTCGLDDTVRSIDLLSNQYSNLSIKMDSARYEWQRRPYRELGTVRFGRWRLKW